MRNFLRRIRLMLNLAANDRSPAMSDDDAALAKMTRQARNSPFVASQSRDAASNYAKSFKNRG